MIFVNLFHKIRGLWKISVLFPSWDALFILFSQDPGAPRIWEVVGKTTASHSPPTLYITTPSPPSQTCLTDPPLHLILLTRETFFLTKCCCWLILKPSFPLLLISFTLFPSATHPAGLSFCKFTGFLAIFKVVNIDHDQQISGRR